MSLRPPDLNSEFQDSHGYVERPSLNKQAKPGGILSIHVGEAWQQDHEKAGHTVGHTVRKQNEQKVRPGYKTYQPVP